MVWSIPISSPYSWFIPVESTFFGLNPMPQVCLVTRGPIRILLRKALLRWRLHGILELVRIRPIADKRVRSPACTLWPVGFAMPLAVPAAGRNHSSMSPIHWPLNPPVSALNRMFCLRLKRFETIGVGLCTPRKLPYLFACQGRQREMTLVLIAVLHLFY